MVVENRAAVEQLPRRRDLDLSRGDPWALDGERRALLQKVEQLRHRQRVCGEEIARRGRAREDAADLKTEMKGVSDEIKGLETRLAEVEEALREALLRRPQRARTRACRVARTRAATSRCAAWASRRASTFTPRPHWELGPELGILDFERAAKISGARFAVQWGAGARLERALVALHARPAHGRARLHRGGPAVPGHRRRPAAAPASSRSSRATSSRRARATATSTSSRPRRCRSPTCTRTRSSRPTDLPKHYVAFTPCFRSEAGSYGKDVRGSSASTSSTRSSS